MLGDGLVDHSPDVVFFGHVGRDGGARLDVGADDGGTFCGELVGYRLADSLCGAGDDGDTVVELAHGLLLELVEVGRVPICVPRVHVVREVDIGSVLLRE